MITVKIIFPDGNVQPASAEPGTRLADLLPSAAADMPCGGLGLCGKCRVAARGGLSEPDAEELRLLGGDLNRGIRLACRAHVTGDAEVFLSGSPAPQEIQSDGLMPAFEPDPLFHRCGAAVDIGTTTLAARLYGRGGELLAQASAENPQRVFGADVISRIEKSLTGARPALAACVQERIDAMLSEMAEDAGLASEEIDAVVLTGNTTMLYLLTARDPSCLSCAPFEADELFGRELSREELRFSAAPSAALYLPRCMSAFVGADITTALLASGICDQPEKALLADIGTNGELAYWNGEKLLCCSTAAGPVFEGAGISQGMQGRPGAIDHVTWDGGSIRCHVIGGGKASGICGSGVIDALAVLCEREVIDESGYMEEDPFRLTAEVSLTARDVRMVQLAKSAICAGALTLLEAGGQAGL